MSILDKCDVPSELADVCGLVCTEQDLPGIRTMLLINWTAAAVQREIVTKFVAAGYSPDVPFTASELDEVKEASEAVDSAGGVYNEYKTSYGPAITTGPKLRDAAILAYCAASALKAAADRLKLQCDPLESPPAGFLCVDEGGAWRLVPEYVEPSEPDPQLPPPSKPIQTHPDVPKPAATADSFPWTAAAIAGGVLLWFLKK